jgi:predicted nucleotidyltransferase
MTTVEIFRRLAEHRSDLDALSVRELLLFGSHARNEASATSDLDFVVEFCEKSFDRYMGLKELLESIFQRRVDLIIKSSIKPRLRERILAEAIRAA